MISVQNLTFHYESNYENIFENVSFQLDTDWKTGFISRNGRGKTTFLKLLMGEFPYSGRIESSVSFDYFPFPAEDTKRPAIELLKEVIAPYKVWEDRMEQLLDSDAPEDQLAYSTLLQRYLDHDGYTIDEQIKCEAGKLGVSSDALARPFSTLSYGERTKLLLGALFLKKNNFLLIDEPTNHLDLAGKQAVAGYLACKKGFILVSHDRDFLDRTVDHILSINRAGIEIQKGNFTTWKQNRDNIDQFERDENEKLKKEIRKLTGAFRRTAGWSDQIEKSKIGEHSADRGFVGHQAAKMMKRAKSIEQRRERALDEKQSLLKNTEIVSALKIHPLTFSKEKLVECSHLTLRYGERTVAEDLNFCVRRGDRIALQGRNGCGKSSVLKLILGETIAYSGTLLVSSGLAISYVPQDSSFLKGSLRQFIADERIDESLFKAILRKLDFSRNQFDKDLEAYSEGQKKKVLLAGSLCRQAHLYIWDEPLNYIDIFSRMQIEELITSYQPTMLFVDHDTAFLQGAATQIITLQQI
nr:ABC-F type ribosomal protection protein [Candidatus Soleaferrea massiliensis]